MDGHDGQLRPEVGGGGVEGAGEKGGGREREGEQLRPAESSRRRKRQRYGECANRCRRDEIYVTVRVIVLLKDRRLDRGDSLKLGRGRGNLVRDDCVVLDRRSLLLAP